MEFHFDILFIISVFFWLNGFYFLFRIPVCKKAVKPTEKPKIAIIIPARNEENNIGNLLDSINIQSFIPNEIIVVNDNSTDRTKEIALEKNAKVIDSTFLPEGWLGKPWACYQGALSSDSDLFIFLDSDTQIEPEGLIKIVDTYNEFIKSNDDPVISIAPYHKVKLFFEEFSAIFNIIMMGSMNAFSPFRKSKPIGLFGQSLVISKENYFKINGHESVKNRILENMFMAELFRKQNINLICFGGKSTLSFRMYGNGFKELIDGWSKAFASGAAQIPFLSLFNIVIWITGGFLIFILSFIPILNIYYTITYLILYLLYCIQIYWMLSRIGTFKIITSILFPLHLIFFCLIFTRSLYLKLFKKKISWKNREV